MSLGHPDLRRGFIDTFGEIWEGNKDTQLNRHTAVVFVELLSQLKSMDLLVSINISR
jgi:hypothetical protein